MRLTSLSPVVGPRILSSSHRTITNGLVSPTNRIPQAGLRDVLLRDDLPAQTQAFRSLWSNRVQTTRMTQPSRTQCCAWRTWPRGAKRPYSTRASTGFRTEVKGRSSFHAVVFLAGVRRSTCSCIPEHRNPISTLGVPLDGLRMIFYHI